MSNINSPSEHTLCPAVRDLPRRHLAVARLWYEANSFNPVPQTLAAFQAREWVSGPGAVSLYTGSATEMGGVIEFLDAHPHWQGHFLRCTSAMPGGPVLQADLDRIVDEIVAGIGARQWDAVYLSLHGALIGTGDLAPELDLLRRIRAMVGPDVPVAASFDMHACLNPEIGTLLDVMTGYRSYPHVDMHATALRALHLLEQWRAGDLRPTVTLHPLPMLPPSHAMTTDTGPMAEVMACALAEQADPAILDASVFGGFAYADTPNTHATICLCHMRGADVSGSIARLSRAMLDRHAAFLPDLPDPVAGLARARDLLQAGAAWPVAVLDPADNPLSGGLGDTTALLRAVVETAADLPTVFSFLHDPALVARAHELGTGAALHAALGGRLATGFGAPVPFNGVVERLTDGRFRNTGPMERGLPVNMGRTAVLRSGNLRVVIAETCHSANDPGWCDLHGIDLRETALFCAKAKNHFRAAFGPSCGAIITIDAPGPAPADLRLLPYRHVPPSLIVPGIR